jgi:hypothetical protein
MGGSLRRKRPGCPHQWEDEPRCQPVFVNHYECPGCGAVWDDAWSAASDDECARCNLDISPSHSEKVAPCACDYLGH